MKKIFGAITMMLTATLLLTGCGGSQSAKAQTIEASAVGNTGTSRFR
ncbi:hypothetical protein [Enterococcus asini]|nr:hypothetical protein [Enterococcus asini]